MSWASWLSNQLLEGLVVRNLKWHGRELNIILSGKLIEITQPRQDNTLICNRLILSTSLHGCRNSSRFFLLFCSKYLLFTRVRISCNINTTARTQHTKRGQETLILPSYSWLMGIYGGLEKNWTLDKNDNKPFLNWLIHYLNYY